MIGKINFVNPILFKGAKSTNSQFHTKPLEYDSFVKSEKQADKKTDTCAYAKDRIIKELEDTGYEYQVVISPDGEILDESVGDDKTCGVDRSKIMPNSELYHGHPKPWPLSVNDIAMLLSTDAISEGVYTKDGNFSKLTKRVPFKLDEKTVSALAYEYIRQMRLMALEKLGISLKANMDDVVNLGKDFLDYTTCGKYSFLDEDDLMKKLNSFGVNTSQDPERVVEDIKNMMFFEVQSNPDKYNKPARLLKEHSDEIDNFLESPEGIKIRHEFDRRAAKDYDLIYETNME